MANLTRFSEKAFSIVSFNFWICLMMIKGSSRVGTKLIGSKSTQRERDRNERKSVTQMKQNEEESKRKNKKITQTYRVFS